MLTTLEFRWRSFIPVVVNTGQPRILYTLDSWINIKMYWLRVRKSVIVIINFHKSNLHIIQHFSLGIVCSRQRACHFDERTISVCLCCQRNLRTSHLLFIVFILIVSVQPAFTQYTAGFCLVHSVDCSFNFIIFPPSLPHTRFPVSDVNRRHSIYLRQVNFSQVPLDVLLLSLIKSILI